MNTPTQRDVWIHAALRHDAQLLSDRERPETERDSLPNTEPNSRESVIPDERWYPDPTLEPGQQRWISSPRQRRTVTPLVAVQELGVLVALGFITGVSLSWLAGSALLAVISAP